MHDWLPLLSTVFPTSPMPLWQKLFLSDLPPEFLSVPGSPYYPLLFSYWPVDDVKQRHLHTVWSNIRQHRSWWKQIQRTTRQTLGVARGFLQKSGRRIAAASGVKDTMRTWLIESIKQGPQGLTETEMAITEPARVYSRPSDICCCSLACGFCGNPNSGCGVSLTILPIHGTLFLLLSFLFQRCYEGLYLVLL